MSFGVNAYGVRLDFFYKALGSQDEKLFDEAFEWLIQGLNDEYSKKQYFEELYLMIFEGVIGSKFSSLIPGLGEIEEHIHHKTIFQAILAILFQDKNAYEQGLLDLSECADDFGPLSENVKLDRRMAVFWNYLFRGRPLKTWEMIGFDYCGYLTNAETSNFIKNLDVDQFEFLKRVKDTLEPVAKQGLDLFFYGG